MRDFSGTYFPQLKNFAYNDIFKNIKQVWDPLKNLDKVITRILAENATGDPIESVPGLTVDTGSSVKSIVVKRWIKLKTPIISQALEIRIDSGTVLEPTAIIKGPSVIGKNNDIRQGSYMRSNVVVGNSCVIGHCTEIKNSILMNHVEAGHFNYIGDSILGSYVNMGAGARLANVQFRSLQEKMENFIAWMKSCYYITATGHPAISVPCGFTPEGLPVGVQIVGRYRDDFGVLQLAKAFENATEFWKSVPSVCR